MRRAQLEGELTAERRVAEQAAKARAERTQRIAHLEAAARARHARWARPPAASPTCSPPSTRRSWRAMREFRGRAGRRPRRRARASPPSCAPAPREEAEIQQRPARAQRGSSPRAEVRAQQAARPGGRGRAGADRAGRAARAARPSRREEPLEPEEAPQLRQRDRAPVNAAASSSARSTRWPSRSTTRRSPTSRSSSASAPTSRPRCASCAPSSATPTARSARRSSETFDGRGQELRGAVADALPRRPRAPAARARGNTARAPCSAAPRPTTAATVVRGRGRGGRRSRSRRRGRGRRGRHRPRRRPRRRDRDHARGQVDEAPDAALSGGEKSMTAIAFLFSVFLAQAVPVLHPRRGRGRARRPQHRPLPRPPARHADRAQFIVVTHQKRTMEAADTLYGVSMGDDGVSKVVSRKMPQRSSVAEARGARGGTALRAARLRPPPGSLSAWTTAHPAHTSRSPPAPTWCPATARPSARSSTSWPTRRTEIFDGLVIDTRLGPGGLRFVDAPEVERDLRARRRPERARRGGRPVARAHRLARRDREPRRGGLRQRAAGQAAPRRGTSSPGATEATLQRLLAPEARERVRVEVPDRLVARTLVHRLRRGLVHAGVQPRDRVAQPPRLVLQGL